MKENSGKSHLIINCTEEITAMTNGLSTDFSKTKVLLKITIDHELKFDDHVNYLCKKAGQKLNALACITPLINVSK